MEFVVESKRDQRTLAWLIAQVGESEVAAACGRLVGARRAYPSNAAKVLGLVLPASLTKNQAGRKIFRAGFGSAIRKVLQVVRDTKDGSKHI